MSKAIKTAISLPWEEFRIIENIRRKAHLSRSKILLEAIHTWIRVRRTEELERRYIAGYKRRPERASEVGGLFSVGLTSFDEKERW